jgi:hypothetical protein
MPKYQIDVPGKGTYEVDSPTELSDAQAYAAIESQLNAPEKKEGALRQAADVPVGVAKGAVQGVRFIADAFGSENPISKNLRGVEDYLGGLMSAQAKDDQQEIARIMKEAEGKGVLEEVKAGIRSFMVAPVDILSQAFGSIAPVVVGGLAGGALRLGATATGIATGSTMGAGAIKGGIYDAVKEELSNTGMSPDQIEKRAILAQEYGGQNLDQILLGAGIGGLSAVTGAEAMLLPGIAKKIAAKAAQKSIIARAVGTGAKEFGTEFLQGGQEQVSQNVALQREGYDVPTYAGAVGAGTMEGLAGGAMGAGVGAFSRPQVSRETPPAQPVQEPVQVAPEAMPEPAPPLVERYQPLSADEARQQSYEQQIARQDARTPVRQYTEPYPQSQFLGVGEAAIQPGQRERAQALAAQQFGLNVGEARTPITEQDRINRQLAAQQQMDADRFKQQTPRPEITPAQAALPTPAPIPSARGFDRQAELLGQRAGLPQVEQVGLEAQADIAGRTGQTATPQTRFVDLTPMPPRVARQKLAALQADAPNSNLNIVPHPQMSGRFAIEERVTPVAEAAEPRREDRPSVSYEQAVQMVRDMQRTGVITPEASAAAQQYGLNIDPMLMNFAERTTPDNLLVQQRQGMADEAALNAELRGGVATQEEAQRLREQGMGMPYDAIQQPAPESRQLGLSERERRLNAEAEAARIAANRKPEAIARRRFQEKLQGPEVDFLEGFDVNMEAEPGPASPEFTEQFMKPEGRMSLASAEATPELKATVDDMRKKLLPILKRFGLEKVGLRLVGSIANGGVDGMYAKQVITLALDSDNPLGVMRHEVIHALKELGAFTDAEWKVLTKAAKDTWINQFFNRDMQDAYQRVYLEQNGNLDGFQEYLQEEAIAQAFRYFSDTTPKGALKEFQKPSGMIANLMRRLNEFFAALSNFFASKDLTVDDMFLPNRIFADIERGAIQPGREQGRVESTPQEWQATPVDVAQAAAYEQENGIAPYLSEGQLQVDVPMARYSLKPAYTPKQLAKGDGDNHPIFGLPLNKNGTITLYLPTNNAEAKRIVREKKLQGNTPDANRIYLTNESSGPKVMSNPGNIDHTMDGANVMIQVDPAYLQLDQEYADGRKDFFIQIAEGKAFAEKMAQMKLFTLDAPRDRAISKETSLAEIEAKIKGGVEAYKALDPKEKRKRLAEARKTLKEQHNVGTLLSENGKLQKTRVGDYGIKFEGNSVASMGLGLASAQKITEKLSSCPRSARCESLCLGETSGQNLLYGGDGQFKSGPRLSQYLKTEAMVIHPEEFAIVLYNEIEAFKKWSAKETGTETVTNDAGEKVKVPKQAYQPAIRLNVTSDFAPKVFEPIIGSFPDVEFYDYTKLNTQTIAKNHHLTYSSDGVAQVVDGKTVGVGSNWKEMVKKLDGGKNVAMAFTSRKAMPEFLLDEATGKKYQVWNGDNYDARFLDPKPGEKGNKLNQGMIIGLTNKDRTGKPEDAAIKNDGFFVDYDPARDGKTLTIKDQSKFVKAQPIKITKEKFSLRAPTTPEFNKLFRGSKIVNPDGTPRLMYHGTTGDISEFILSAKKNRTGNPDGFYFTSDPEQASNYASDQEGANVIPVYLIIKNPFDLMGKNRITNEMVMQFRDELRKENPNLSFDWIQSKVKLFKEKAERGGGLPFPNISFSTGAMTRVFKAGGYDGLLDGGKHVVAFNANQVKSAFNQRPTESPDIRYSLRQQKTPEFKRFFGNSKVVNPDGTPKVMYHGTARIIDEFIPKQAGAIFVTENPEFAGKFSEDSANYKVLDQIDKLAEAFYAMETADQVNFLKKAYRLGAKNNDISKDAAKAYSDAIDNEIKNGKLSLEQEAKYFKFASEFLSSEIRKDIESGQNIMPLYVRAENPFDFKNPAHVEQIYSRLFNKYGEEVFSKERISTGDWPIIENESVQEIIKDLGHDSFYVNEGGQKNLAVYNPNQIKSATGNRGTFDETGRILYSLKNAPPNRYTKLAESAPTTGEAITKVATSAFNAVRNDGTRTSARINLVDRFAGVSKTLSPLPLFSDGVLRADMLHHAKAQGINLIKGGLVSGIPVLNGDGTIGIQISENNLARAAYLADKLDTNQNVVDSGLSGRSYMSEVARILRGMDIIEEDKATRALGEQQISDANFFANELKKELKAGNITATQVVQFQGQIDKLREEGNANRKVNRELQVKPEDIAWAQKQLQITPEVQEILDIWKAVNTSLVDLWENVGLLDKETADKYRAAKNYVPLFKSREDLNEEGFFRTGTGAKTTAKIKALKGATDQRNILENIDKQYATMIAAAYENQTRRVSVEQMRGISEELAEITNASDPRVNLRYRENGKDVHVIIENPNDLAAFQSMTYQLSPIMKAFGGFTKVLRAGALLNPMFWIRQLIRDPISATLTGQAGIVTPFHSAKEFLSVITRNSEEAKILASRGVIGQFDSTVTLQEYLGNVGKDKQQSPGMIQRGLHRLLEIHEASDAATRIAIYKKAKAKAIKDGMSESQAVDYAVFKARESINFALTGNSPTLANLRQMIPFLNATIVGLDTLYRAATGYGLNPEERAKVQRMFATRAMMMVAMTVAYAASLQDDDDYKKLPDYVKDGNWLIPMSTESGKQFVKVTVPYEVGFLFKTLPEVFIRYMSGTSTGKESLASIRSGFIQNMPTGGVPVPQAVRPLLEVVTNHSFFTNRPIEGMGDSRLPVAERGQRASEFAKMMSGLGLDKISLSPAKIDVLTKGYFAELGSFFNELSGAVINTATGKEPTPKNVDNAFSKAFLTDPSVNKAISDFYDIERSAQETANLFNDMKKQGRGEDLRALLADPEKRMQVGISPTLNRIQKNMSDINAAIRIIDRNQSIPPQERRAKINELQGILGKLAEKGNEVAGIAGLSR